MFQRILKIFLCLILVTLFSSTAFAISLVPGSAEPGLVQKNFLPEPLPTAQTLTTKKAPEESPVTPLSPEAGTIKFKLLEIKIEGNHVYTTQELESIYKDKINTEISILELQQIVQDITNYYRNNGYILTNAVLPPQRIDEGIVTVQIVEGFIDQVHVIGNPRGAKPLIQAYGNHIAEVRPLQIEVMEHYLLLANNIPGADVKSVLDPSKTKVGASDLNLVAEKKTFSALLSYDNYGTRYLGPHQVTANVGGNSIFTSGDNITVTYLSVPHDKELRYWDLNYSSYIGTNGLNLTIDANKSLTIPGFLLRNIDTTGESDNYTASLEYPVIQSRSQTLTLDANLAYLNSTSSNFGFETYYDRVRPVQIGGNYSFADSYKGSNVIGIHLMHGFDIWNASTNPNSLFSSRFGADGIFTLWNVEASRNQELWGRYSAFFVAQGQYSYNPLLVGQQFTFGGSQLGRGYDPAEILGDQGIAGSVELRADYTPDRFFMQNIQLYGFYDAGKVWNLRDLPTSYKNQSATSTGFGARFMMSPYIHWNVMWTQPITKQVSAEELVGCGKCSRIFFSITAAA